MRWRLALVLFFTLATIVAILLPILLCRGKDATISVIERDLPITNSAKILILGIVRNVANSFKSSQIALQKTLETFPNASVRIYENNSTDATRNVLGNFKAVYPDRVALYMEDVTSAVGCRVEKIARARNRLLELVADELANYTYVMWIDMDGGVWRVNGIVDSLQRADQWDIVTADGLNWLGEYYDTYCLRDEYNRTGPELVGDMWWSIPRSRPVSNGNPLYPVYSAFGGIGIYKTEIFRSLRYSALPTPEVDTVYRELLRKPADAPLQYKPNSNCSEKAVICEHISVNFAARTKGFTRQFINLNMLYMRR